VVVGYVAGHPEALEKLRENPKLILTATEEFFRCASTITHIGRLCPADTDVVEKPGEVWLDRKPNPHIAFGNGTHNCLGAAHARLIVRTLLKKLCELTARVEKISEHRKMEKEAGYERMNAFHSLTVKMIPR
jgi:cytochrome P450